MIFNLPKDQIKRCFTDYCGIIANGFANVRLPLEVKLGVHVVQAISVRFFISPEMFGNFYV